MRKQWTNIEICLLKNLYEADGLSVSEILDKFPNRTETAIGLKIKKLKLRHTSEQKYSIWSRVRQGEKNPMYGRIPYTKGYTKDTLECLNLGSKKLSNTIKSKMQRGEKWGVSGSANGMYGRHAWNFGQTKDTNEIVKQYGKNISIVKKAQWILLPEPEKEKRRICWAHAGLNCKKKLTSIEIKIQKFLEEKRIEFKQNYKLGRFIMDFYLPKKNLVIECQGDYWHTNPRKYKNGPITDVQKANALRDKKKIEYLTENKIPSIFLWEYDIHNNFDAVQTEIIQKIC